jgi:hypothetical protein
VAPGLQRIRPAQPPTYRLGQSPLPGMELRVVPRLTAHGCRAHAAARLRCHQCGGLSSDAGHRGDGAGHPARGLGMRQVHLRKIPRKWSWRFLSALSNPSVRSESRCCLRPNLPEGHARSAWRKVCWSSLAPFTPLPGKQAPATIEATKSGPGPYGRMVRRCRVTA